MSTGAAPLARPSTGVARTGVPRRRIGYAVMTPFQTVDNGGALRRAQLAWSIAQQAELHVIYVSPSLGVGDTAAAPTTLDLPFGLRAPVWRSRDANEARTHLLRRVWNDAGLDALVVDWIGTTHDTLLLPDDAPILVNTHNVESDLYLQMARDAGGLSLWRLRKLRRLRDAEQIGRARAFELWCVSEKDSTRYRELLGDGIALRVVPNVASPLSFVEHPATGSRGTGAFVGSMSYPPNRRAVTELAALSDRLTERGVGHRFDVIGPGDARALISGRRSMHAVGYVSDLAETLQRACAFVAPITYGGGTKTKILDALAAGRPVLTTPAGIAGIDGVRDGEHIVVRDLGPSFDRSAEDMLRDPSGYRRLALAGQALVRSRYSIHHMLDAVSASLGSVFAD